MSKQRISKKFRTAAAASAVLAGLAVGTTAVAGASTSSTHHTTTASTHSAPQGGPGDGPRGHRGGPVATVTAVTATTLTVEGGPNNTSVTIDLTSSTTYQKNGVSATLADIKVGDKVAIEPVAPTSSSTSAPTPPAAGSTITAASVTVLSPSLMGTVVSVTGTSGNAVITVSDGEGFYRTIDTSASTTYRKGSSSGSFADITVGEQLVAFGSVSSNHEALDASTVVAAPVAPSGAAGGPGGPDGDQPPFGG